MSITSINVDNTLGCFYISTILTTALWTLSTGQLYIYINHCPKDDSWRLKTYVSIVWLVDTGLQAAILRTAYKYFVGMFGNFIDLIHFDKSTFPLFTIMSAFVNILVQSLVLVRIWHMSKRSKLLTSSAAALVLVQFAVTISYFGAILPFSQLFQLHSVITVERIMDVTIAAVDTVIGIILSLLLNSNRSGFKGTDSMINLLIIYTVASGLLTAADAIITLIVSLVFPGTLWYFMFAAIGPKLYVNSMLALFVTCCYYMQACVLKTYYTGLTRAGTCVKKEAKGQKDEL